jgi:hypothetical protein
MKAVVKKSYIVMQNGFRFVEGMEIPSNLLPSVLQNQSWKIEVIEDGKKEKEDSSSTGATKEETEKEKEIEDITSNRMMEEKKVRKRG